MYYGTCSENREYDKCASVGIMWLYTTTSSYNVRKMQIEGMIVLRGKS